MSHEYKTAAELSQEIKENLQKAFPQCKWSVTKKSYSGGRSITVALMAAPFAVFEQSADETPYSEQARHDGYAQLNPYSFRESNAYAVERYGYTSNGVRLTEAAWKVMQQADEIGNARNWDNSDSMTDYYDVNFAFDLHIGKWDRPFAQLEPKPAPATETQDAPAAIAGATITQERDWLWITFASKPAQEVIDRLRSLGAQWSKRRAAWYLTDASKAGELATLAA